MKLLKSAACHLASDGGNVKEMTVMGDAAMERFSDRGSIPLSSIKWKFFYVRCLKCWMRSFNVLGIFAIFKQENTRKKGGQKHIFQKFLYIKNVKL